MSKMEKLILIIVVGLYKIQNLDDLSKLHSHKTMENHKNTPALITIVVVVSHAWS
jgi:hypothetical protein